MKIYDELSLVEFKAWSGAIETKNTIIENGLANEFDALIEELYPNGISATELNDILWFDDEWIFESLGLEIDG